MPPPHTQARPKPSRLLRPALLKLHRWAGLALAAFLVLTGLTGAVMAWTDELDALLNPHMLRTPGTPAQDAAQLLALAAQVEAAQPQWRVTSLPLALEPGQAAMLRVAAKPHADADASAGTNAPLGFDQLFVHPASGQILGQRQWGQWRGGSLAQARQDLLPFIYRLHYSLHLPGEWGVWLMGGVALLWALDCLWALALAFPSRKAWRKSFAFRWGAGGHKLTFDLHRSGSVWLWPLLLVLAITGVGLNLRTEVMQPLVAWFSPVPPEPWAGRQPLPPGQAAIGRERALQLALEQARQRGWLSDAPSAAASSPAAPASPATSATPAPAAAKALGLQPWRLHDWQDEDGLYAVAFAAPGREPYGPALGPHWVYLDAASGTVAGVRTGLGGSAGEVFMAAQYPLHSGRILGVAGRALVSLLGLAVAVISVTGVMIWLRKRRAGLPQRGAPKG
ncbi:PepSY domain-containing protein [Allofranklinella schreckenbergeri]|uniref:PepSY domain-containing protein n=1 Tax=Allofranklinella schreckenbergeri TaxID=1076744 RepID=A0A3M6Q791_9BURK|nr:PepSY-associated TM helix domain-containing protein [Allofranklinella schreckenbergeri]RMW98674.1 PepSY domain-containing protein [Allofranklinella schreckenbergeri]